MASDSSVAAGLAQRYAGALYELADEGKALDAVLADLKKIEAARSQSADLRRAMSSPLLPRKAQEAALLAVAQALGIGDLVRRFLGTLARNRRLGGFSTIFAAYRDLLAAKRGETTAEVVSAVELTDAQKAAMQALIAQVRGKYGPLPVTTHAAVSPGRKNDPDHVPNFRLEDYA